MVYNVYIYGAGRLYNQLASYVHLYEKNLNILGIVTTEKPLIKYLDGYPCLQISEMEQGKADYIIIAVKEWKVVVEMLYGRGVPEEKIIRATAFMLPYFDLEKYIELKNSKVSILSRTCIAGLIYNELGLKVYTPTTNCFCTASDYIKFLKNYKHYLESEMVEYIAEPATGMYDVKDYMLKGIIDQNLIWYFNHSNSIEQCVNRWNEKRKQVNFDNVIAITSIDSDDMAYQFEELKIEKKLGLYYKDLGGEVTSIVYCPEWTQNISKRMQYSFNWSTYALDYLTNRTGLIGKVDWIKFLLGEKEYLRFY